MRIIYTLVYATLAGVYLLYINAQDTDNSIKPADYQKMMGHGFTTKYFKTLKFDKLYRKQNLVDIKAKGFTNIRVRCRQDLKNLNMTKFLGQLETVIDDCVDTGIIPVVSWIHHKAEAIANETHRLGYLDWWKQVATKLKDKSYKVSFDLFTELGFDSCGNKCEESLRGNLAKYTNWTTDVIKVIRDTGGNNDKRIIFMASPAKTGKGLQNISSAIYKNDSYLMVEWHVYASGPTKNRKKNGTPTFKYWSGNGTGVGRTNVDREIGYARTFTNKTGLKDYLAEWMPQDNNRGNLNQTEMINFLRYWIPRLNPTPWSINSIDNYYNTKKSKWKTGIQTVSGQAINFSQVLDEIIAVKNTTIAL